MKTGGCDRPWRQDEFLGGIAFLARRQAKRNDAIPPFFTNLIHFNQTIRMAPEQTRNKYYVVVKGRQPGIYTKWDGPDGAAAQVNGVSGAQYRGFKNALETRWWLEDNGEEELLRELKELAEGGGQPGRNAGCDPRTRKLLDAGKVVIYTDGGAINNPGPGGYGAVLRSGDRKKELSAGFRRTTNNRMELLACIRALGALKRQCEVVLHSDSKYVVNGIEKGWAVRWRSNGWKRNKRESAKNVDMWAPLLDLTEHHEVEFRWVKGHAGNRDNERCDRLATSAAKGTDLERDVGFETGNTQRPPRSDQFPRT